MSQSRSFCSIIKKEADSILNNLDKIFYIIILIKMDRNPDISYDSDESEDDDYRNPNAFNPPQDDPENNRTADTFKLNLINEEDDREYIQGSKIFQKFYNSQLFRSEEKRKEKSFLKHKIFDRYRKSMRVYLPQPNLYFLPIRVIIDSKNEKPLRLRDQIVDYFIDANVQIPKQRPQQIIVKIHNQREMQLYIIRFNTVILKQKHNNPQLLDQDLSLNPLFQFYENNYDHLKFSQTCGIFLYWAYQKKLLNPDYLSESALKIIVIFYFFNMGLKVPNIVNEYMNKKKSQLQRIQKLYSVNKKLECELQPELFQYSNFSIIQKRSFYKAEEKKYSIMTQILPVPYPVTQDDFEQFSKNPTNIKQVHPIIKFFNLMQYLENCIKRSERVIIDFTKDRKGASNKPELDFNIEIKHPVFGNNICQRLTNDQSKLRILKLQINNTMSIYRKCTGNPLDTLVKIFDKN